MIYHKYWDTNTDFISICSALYARLMKMKYCLKTLSSMYLSIFHSLHHYWETKCWKAVPANSLKVWNKTCVLISFTGNFKWHFRTKNSTRLLERSGFSLEVSINYFFPQKDILNDLLQNHKFIMRGILFFFSPERDIIFYVWCWSLIDPSVIL